MADRVRDDGLDREGSMSIEVPAEMMMVPIHDVLAPLARKVTASDLKKRGWVSTDTMQSRMRDMFRQTDVATDEGSGGMLRMLMEWLFIYQDLEPTDHMRASFRRMVDVLDAFEPWWDLDEDEDVPPHVPFDPVKYLSAADLDQFIAASARGVTDG